jgi:hypothetical protein
MISDYFRISQNLFICLFLKFSHPDKNPEPESRQLVGVVLPSGFWSFWTRKRKEEGEIGGRVILNHG